MTENFKMGSLFDGSGGFPLASVLCGIEPVWASEVEPFPIRVTTKRFPNMKHLGDISKIDVSQIEPVDLITGGSPCQDMSVAGNRKGMSKHCPKCGYKDVANNENDICPDCGSELEYTRSGLFMEQIRIVKEMRQLDESNGRTDELIRPRFMLWENVTGAFTSNKGEDFRAVLEETARIKDKTAIIPRPPKGKWNTEGCIVGDGWSIAWRVFDAQFWGVPQRRRRIALVADFGGQCAGEILFKREGLQRNFTESRHSWQSLTGCFAEGIGEAGECCIGFDSYNHLVTGDKGRTLSASKADAEHMPIVFEPIQQVPITMQVRCGKDGGGKGALLQKDLSATLSTSNMQTLFQPIHCVENSTGRNTLFMTTDVSPTLVSDTHNHACCIPIQDQAISNGSGHGLGVGNEDDPMYSLTTATQHGICVLEGNGSRPSHRGDGYKESDIMYTLNSTEQHGVAYAFEPGIAKRDGSENRFVKECTPTLRSNMGDNQTAVAYGLDRASFNQGKNAQYDFQITEEQSATIVAKGPTAVAHPTFAMQRFGDYKESDVSSSLKYRDYKDATDLVVETEYIVRRLIPLECSRLQGFPDWWLDGLETPEPDGHDIAFWREVFETHRKVVTGAKKPKTDKQIIKWLKNPYSDGAAYKLWGNGIALPCFLYVIEGIKEILDITSNK